MLDILGPFRRRTEVVIECRQCGTTVPRATGACPTCGRSGFAEYVIPS